MQLCHTKVVLEMSSLGLLKRNKSRCGGAIYLNEIITTNHNQLKSRNHASGLPRTCSISGKFATDNLTNFSKQRPKYVT